MRIDAARKQRLEPLIDARPAQRLLHERIEAEPRQVSLIKHDRMPQCDGLAVIGLLADHIKQQPSPRAIASIPVEQRAAIHGVNTLPCHLKMSNELWPPL